MLCLHFCTCFVTLVFDLFGRANPNRKRTRPRVKSHCPQRTLRQKPPPSFNLWPRLNDRTRNLLRTECFEAFTLCIRSINLLRGRSPQKAMHFCQIRDIIICSNRLMRK